MNIELTKTEKKACLKAIESTCDTLNCIRDFIKGKKGHSSDQKQNLLLDTNLPTSELIKYHNTLIKVSCNQQLLDTIRYLKEN